MHNEYLQGVLAPVRDELELRALPVEGEIPRGLRGTYLRNGPNPAFEPLPGYHIWDGDGMLHALRFDEGGVHYHNRWIETPGLALEREHGRALFGGLRNPVTPPPEIAGELGGVKNAANTSIVRHAGRLLALWEGGLPTRVADDLSTLGPYDFGGRLQGHMTAHPKIDPVDGEMLFFHYSFMPPHLVHHVVDAGGRLLRSVPLDLPRGVMMHDFVVTREHVVFFDSPMVFDFENRKEGDLFLRWKPELGARIGVLPRGGSNADMRFFEIDPCYVFHFLNAWSEPGRLRITGAASDWVLIDYENGQVPKGVDANSYLYEFTLDLEGGSVKKQRLGELPGEFCKIPDALAGLPHRYGYLASFSQGHCEGVYFDALTKVDLESRSEASHFFPGQVVGEPCFAPDLESRAGKGAEDAGFVLAYVHERDGSASQFVVLDARDITAEPLARIHMPRRVPLGFHGNWMPFE